MGKKKPQSSNDPSRRRVPDLSDPRHSTLQNSRPSSPTPYSQGQSRYNFVESSTSGFTNLVDIQGKTQAFDESSITDASQVATVGGDYMKGSNPAAQTQEFYEHRRRDSPGVSLSTKKTKTERQRGGLDNFNKTGVASRLSKNSQGKKRKEGAEGDEAGAEAELEGLGRGDDRPRKSYRRDHSPSDEEDAALAGREWNQRRRGELVGERSH